MTNDKGREILRKRFNATPNMYKVDEKAPSLTFGGGSSMQPSIQQVCEYAEWLEGQLIEMAMGTLFSEDS